MGISLELANFVANTKYENIPAEVIATQKKSVLDNIGNILGASGIGDGCKEFVDIASELSGPNPSQEATVIGFDIKLPAVWAAFANASMSHSLDYEDCHLKGSHPNSATFPAALAISEKLGNVHGKDFLTALVVGSEVACRMHIANKFDSNTIGFYPPSIYTSFAATAAVSKLLGLTPEQIVDALSFNLCQTTCSSEILNNSKSVIRSVRECFGAKNAIISAYAAKKNLKGFDFPLEGEKGFYFAYSKGNYFPELVTDGLGKIFEAGNLSFKPWPSCLGTHTAIDATLRLVKENDIHPEEVERVHIKVSQGNAMLVEPDELKKAPGSSINAKFSTPYTVATAIANRSVGLNDFEPMAISNPKVLGIAAKITHEVVKEWDQPKRLYSEVSIFTSRGCYSKLMTVPYGYPQEPMTYPELCSKMRDCASRGRKKYTANRLDALQHTVEHLESLDNILELTKLF